MMSRIFHITIVALSIALMAWIVVNQWNQFQAIYRSFNPYFFSAAFLGIIGLFLLDAYGWHLILKALSQSIPATQSISIWFLSSVTRYLPGGFWPYVSRASLAKNHGVDITTSSVSLYIETLLLATSSLAVGFPALLGAANVFITPLSALLIFIAFGFLLHPKIIMLLRFIPGKTGKAIISVKLPDLSCIAGLYFYYVMFWIFFGLIFVCFVYAFYPIPYKLWIHVGSALALSFFTGFVIVFFPGGIGIRETTLYLLLVAYLPHSASLLISIGSRLWFMLGEGLLIFLILIWKSPVRRMFFQLFKLRRGG